MSFAHWQFRQILEGTGMRHIDALCSCNIYDIRQIPKGESL